MQILFGAKKERGRLSRAGEQRLCEELEAGESRGCGQVLREAGETVEQWSEVLISQKARPLRPCGLMSQNTQDPPGQARTSGNVTRGVMPSDLVFKRLLQLLP